MRRVVVVYNRRATGFSRVEREVLSFLRQKKGIILMRFEVKQVGVRANVEKLAKILREGDLVIAVGGDGTATIAMNGVMESEKKAELAVLPFGNFNDMAKIGGLSQVEEVFSGVVREVYPMEVLVNGKRWRYAMCYVTLGLMAEGAELFEDERVRRRLRKIKWGKRIYSLWRLFLWFMKNRNKGFSYDGVVRGWSGGGGVGDGCGGGDYLESEVSGENESWREEFRGFSDFWMVNGERMAGVMKGGGVDRCDGQGLDGCGGGRCVLEDGRGRVFCDKFLAGGANLRGLFGMIGFVLSGMARGVRGREFMGVEIVMRKGEKVVIQAEGESEQMRIERLKLRKRKGVLMVFLG